jgi:uncharacterized protein YbjT (DUF2867 family)
VNGVTAETVLVLGGTGTVGRRVADLLAQRGSPVRLATRHGSPPFDWADPGTWPAAVEGATAAFVMAPDGVAVDPAFLAAAADAGVRRMVLLSSRAIEVMGDERLLAAEAAMRHAGPEWVVVRADWFDQNFDEGFLRDAVLAGQVAVPVGGARQGFVDAGDVAAVAVAALMGDVPAGTTVEVTGPEALSFAEAVEHVSCAAGRPVSFAGDPATYTAAMTGLGFPAEQVSAEMTAFRALAEQGDPMLTDAVQRYVGRAPLPFAVYARAAAERGAWVEPTPG